MGKLYILVLFGIAIVMWFWIEDEEEITVEPMVIEKKVVVKKNKEMTLLEENLTQKSEKKREVKYCREEKEIEEDENYDEKKEIYSYDSEGRVSSIENGFFTAEVDYGEEAVASDKMTLEDIKALTSQGDNIKNLLEDERELIIKYREEHDENGRKISAYTLLDFGSVENRIHRKITYGYDDEGNLIRKTFFDGSSFGSTALDQTTLYTKSGEIKGIYVDDKKTSAIGLSKKAQVLLGLIDGNVSYGKLKKSFKYDENGRLKEEYDMNDGNISYIYDEHQNLIKKVKESGEVLEEYSYKICS